MFKYLIVLLAISTASVDANLFAQQRVISGTVINERGEPVDGATVTVKGSNLATNTNTSGVYRLEVPASARTLIFSSSEFTTRKLISMEDLLWT